MGFSTNSGANLKTFLIPSSFLFLLVVLVGCQGAAKKFSAPDQLVWSELPLLPDSTGFGGPAVGVHNDVLFVAGGSNFPYGPPWENGVKVWYDNIFVLTDPDTTWDTRFRLPGPRAYSAVVSTPDGVVLAGGDDGEELFSSVIRLRWNTEKEYVEVDSLPSLPVPTTFATAAWMNGRIYVFAGQQSLDPTDLAHQVWSLDPASNETKWRNEPAWPGSPRMKSAAIVQKDGSGREGIYLISGEIPELVDDSLVVRNTTREVLRFDPETGGWTRESDLPIPLIAAPVVASGPAHILMLGGTTGENVGKIPLQDFPPFQDTAWAYHTVTDTWADVGSLEEPVVTAGAVAWRGGFVVASGEVKPGIRTRRVKFAEIRIPSGRFGWVNYSVLFAYFAFIVGLGIYFSRKNSTPDDFFLAGRRIPWWAAGLSIYATQLSAITFLATPALAFATNWLVAPVGLAIFVSAPFVVRYYLPFFRRLHITSAYEYLEKRFGISVRLFGSASFIVFQLARMGIVLYLPALALSAITGMSVYLCVGLMGVLAIFYTTLGGMEAVVWTDVIQSVVLLGGVVLGIIIIVTSDGGVGAAVESAMESGKLKMLDFRMNLTDITTWAVLIGGVFLQFGPYTTDQAVIQRYLTTRDEKAAAKGIWMNAWMSLPSIFLFFIVGTALFVYFKLNPDLLHVGMETDRVFPVFMVEGLPNGISGLIVAGVFAASMSTLDSSLHAISTAVTTDFYERFVPSSNDRSRLFLARSLVVGVGLLATAAAIMLATYDVQSVFLLFQAVLGLISSGLAGIFFLGVFTKRANTPGVWIGAVISIVLLAYISSNTTLNLYWYAAVGIMTSIACGYVASLFFHSEKELDGLTRHSML